MLLDGGIVALDAQGRPAGFQRLQGRIHLVDARDVEKIDKAQPVALIVFDVLRDGDEDVRGLPLTGRRVRLEQLLRSALSSTLRISEQVAGDGRELEARARREGWEGLIAKESRSPYQSGRRSPAWRKRKLLHEQEFVVGGWTEPRQTRQHFGALLLGVRENGRDALKYVGHTGTGFNGAELDRVWKLLAAREIRSSPFSARIKTNEPAHWVRPDLVAQVRFTEWTSDDKLRQPVYLGLRDDKRAADVVREEPRGTRPTSKGSRSKTAAPAEPTAPSVQSQLQALEDARRDGTVSLPDGRQLAVTNLAKLYWPAAKITKGDLLRYYAEVAPMILPAVADRPLVMKRFPNGIGGMAFYQQRSRQEKPPAGVRVETLAEGLDPISEPDARRFVGGDLITLLYMTQIAAISRTPGFRGCNRRSMPTTSHSISIPATTLHSSACSTSRAGFVTSSRYCGCPPCRRRQAPAESISTCRCLRRHLYESGMLFCQIVATVIAARHPRVATVERTVRARPRGTVYVDFLQNILGKTLATAYSARASSFAGVSTPLRWEELDENINPQDFTIRSAPGRFRQVGDLWARLRSSRPADLEAVFRKYQAREGSGGAASIETAVKRPRSRSPRARSGR